MRRTVVMVGLVAVMLLGAAYASAQAPGFGPGHGHGRGFGPGPGGGPGWSEGRPCGQWGMDAIPNLTPEQKTKMGELRRKFRDDNAQLIGALVTKRIEVQSLWSNPKADDKAILDKTKEMRDLQNQMRDKAIQMRLEARKILTPEQIAQMPADKGCGPGAGRGFGRGFGSGCGRGCGQGLGGSY